MTSDTRIGNRAGRRAAPWDSHRESPTGTAPSAFMLWLTLMIVGA
jgi:hypothetical protein